MGALGSKRCCELARKIIRQNHGAPGPTPRRSCCCLRLIVEARRMKGSVLQPVLLTGGLGPTPLNEFRSVERYDGCEQGIQGGEEGWCFEGFVVTVTGPRNLVQAL